jgi:YteA family regulatory protein
MITNEQLRKLRSMLESEMGEIQDRLSDDAYGLKRDLFDSMGELSWRDNHPADFGSEMFERSKDLALRDADSLRLADIDEALERMGENLYGTCDGCGAEIPYERLEANPAAKLCVECKEGAEEIEISANRPVEENFLYPGFGRTFMDSNDEDQNGYDGEDAWQDVARYGTSATNDENFGATKPEDNYVDADERLGYVEDIERVALCDIEGNQIENPQFDRNASPYRRLFEEADQRYWNER